MSESMSDEQIVAAAVGAVDNIRGEATDEEIAANRGKTYQDVTALRDPLRGWALAGETWMPSSRKPGTA